MWLIRCAFVRSVKLCKMDSLAGDDLLIEEARQRPVLFDQRLRAYRDKQRQQDAWEE